MAEPGFIGYSSEGYEALHSAIPNKKENILNILNSFPEVVNAIEDSWKGPDADEYVSQLNTLISKTKTSITDIYTEMDSAFTDTYNRWVEKQSK